MKIQLVSDLHLECSPYTLQVQPDVDVVVMAGDFGPPTKTVLGRVTKILDSFGQPVVAVLGNHDYYGGTNNSATEMWVNLFAQRRGADLLLNSFTEIGGVRFVGGTLWTRFNLYSPDWTQAEAIECAKYGISDFSNITVDDEIGGCHPVEAQDMMRWNKWCRDTIALAGTDPKPTVVVTHFLPTAQAIHPRWRTSGKLNAYFCSPSDELFQPHFKAWLFGHTHDSMDFRIGETRFVCNPRGYTQYGTRENNGFNSKLVIEI